MRYPMPLASDQPTTEFEAGCWYTPLEGTPCFPSGLQFLCVCNAPTGTTYLVDNYAELVLITNLKNKFKEVK